MVSMDSGVPLGSAIEGNEISLASQASGDVMYYNGTSWVRLAKGTATQALKMNSGATAPEWADDEKGLTLMGTATASSSGSITVSSLDIDTDGYYLIVGKLKNGSGGVSNMRLFFNGDTTVTNYYVQNNSADNNTISGARGNSCVIGQDTTNGGDLIFYGYVYRDISGYIRYQGTNSYKAPSSVLLETRTIVTTGSATNLTSITLNCQSGNFTDGSNFSVYKIN